MRIFLLLCRVHFGTLRFLFFRMADLHISVARLLIQAGTEMEELAKIASEEARK